MFLIDTCILIDYQNCHPGATIFLENLSHSEMNISCITYMEFLRGARDKGDLNLLQKYVKNFKSIQIEPKISVLATQLLEQYALQINLGIPDALIAATAIHKKYTLVTNNIKHFKNIPKLKILKAY